MIHRTVCLLVALLTLAGAARAADGGRDSWMALYIGDAKSGHSHEKRYKSFEDGEQVWVTETETTISLARMGRPLLMVAKSTVVESLEGRVIRFETSQDMGAGVQTTKGEVSGGKILMKTSGFTRVVDYPAGAVGPAATERKMFEEGLEPGTTTKVISFVTEAPDRRAIATSVVGPLEKKDVLGRVVLLHHVTMNIDILPMDTHMWVDETGRPLATEMTVQPLGKIRTFLTEKRVALAENEPAEIFVNSFVHPDRTLPDPRKLGRAVYLLGKKEGALDKIYEGEGQRIVSSAIGKLIVEVAVMADPKADVVFQVPAKVEGMQDYLEGAPYLETEDEGVVALAREAVGDEKNALAAAKRIENFVRKKIRDKTLNVGFASAAEVAKTLEGDCTEHAVLACAMARVVGLPARVVTGLVYLPPSPGAEEVLGEHGVFGYHMWTEILVAPDHWLPIDAAIGTYDATHIAIGKSDLGSGSPAFDMTLAILDVIGTLSIKVVEPK